jgi:SurA-like protein
MLRLSKVLIVSSLLMRCCTLSAGEILDRIVAVVNHQTITLSDVERERKFLEIEPGADHSSPTSSEQSEVELTQRLIDQSLIRQQLKQFPGIDVSSEDIEKQITSLRQATGSTQAWDQQIQQLALNPKEIREHVKWQLQVEKFFDYRFRQFALVDPKEIEEYYSQKLLPELAAKGIQKPSLAEVEEKIQAILAEDKVNLQIDDWLKSLRESASIEVFD